MKISICVAHAPWAPHLSGYGSAPEHQEYFFSYEVATALKQALEADICGVSVDVLDISHQDRDCFGACVSGVKQPSRRRILKKKCKDYRAGHHAMNGECVGSDLALEFHLDYWHHRQNTPMGPMCMISGRRSNWAAMAWAETFLSKMEVHRNQPRRWKRQYNGIINVDSDTGYKPYGFLKDGCENAVIIEAAVVNHPADIEWLDSDQAIPQLVAASTDAVLAICG